MKHILLLVLFSFLSHSVTAQLLPGFKPAGSYNEQQLVIENSPPGTRILINAPIRGFGKNDEVLLIFYALPNGSSIEHTFGKKRRLADDFRFDIQHIGAQTRFLRNTLKDRTIVVGYLENDFKSWPAWAAGTPEPVTKIKEIVNSVKCIFDQWNPQVVLNGHSGGGRFILSYINASEEIPPDVIRIAFLDSSYGYEDTVHGPKITAWLKSDKNRYLCTLAYNDSVVIYNGKPLVSPTGGTWYRSKMMKNFLSESFRFREEERDSLLWSRALGRRIEVILKPNPGGKIFHTTQVELNGFIHSILSGTEYENKGYFYFKERSYSGYIADSLILPIRCLNIPPRSPVAESGTAFMKRIAQLPLSEREEEIYNALASGNIPDFLRNTVILDGEFADAKGSYHRITYEAMPDYLSVGNDTDFCRIPMNPYTAQRLASDFGASLITAAVSDHIFKMSEIKLDPFNYVPVGNQNELVMKFADHNMEIERQLREAGGKRGQLVAGIKKDVILSVRLASQPGKVVIYGWHYPDGRPVQPVYSGHIYWYVDYSHGIRFINNQVLIDGKPGLFSDILKDPLLYKVFSDEDAPMNQVIYIKQRQE